MISIFSIKLQWQLFTRSILLINNGLLLMFSNNSLIPNISLEPLLFINNLPLGLLGIKQNIKKLLTNIGISLMKSGKSILLFLSMNWTELTFLLKWFGTIMTVSSKFISSIELKVPLFLILDKTVLNILIPIRSKLYSIKFQNPLPQILLKISAANRSLLTIVLLPWV